MAVDVCMSVQDSASELLCLCVLVTVACPQVSVIAEM